MKKFVNELIYKGERVQCILEHYDYDSSYAISLYTMNGEPYVVATLCGEFMTQGNEVIIKNYSENEGMDKFLIENNVIQKEVLRLLPFGFCVCPVHELNMELFEEIDETELYK